MGGKILALVGATALIAGAEGKDYHSAKRDVLFKRHSAPRGYKLAGLADDTERVDLIVALKQKNLDKLEKKFWAVSDPTNPEYGQFMTGQEIQDLVAPNPKIRNKVATFFRQFCDEVVDNGDNLRASCSAGQAREMLHTSFFKFKGHKQMKAKLVKAMGEWSLPHHIAKHVDFIDGVSNFPIEHLRVNHHPAPAPASAPVDDKPPAARGLKQFGGAVNVPQTMFAQYKIGDAKATSSQSHGVIEFQQGEAFSPSDLQNFGQETAISISAVSKAHQHGSFLWCGH